MILSQRIDRDEFDTGTAGTALAGPPRSDRPRIALMDCQLERGPAAFTRVTLRFSGPSFVDGIFVSRQEGTTCEGGDLRLAALAAFEALAAASGGWLRFELIGVKPIRAFDTMVMMVAAMVHDDAGSRRVVGAAIVEGDPMSAAVRAALHAANRMVAPLTSSIA